MPTSSQKTRSRAGSLALALVLVTVAHASMVGSAEGSTVISFVPLASEVNCNELVDVDISIDVGVADLRGYSLVVTFDAALLELVDVLPGQLMVDASCDPFLRWFDLTPGEARVDAAGLGCSVAGPGAIARLRLQGLADGVSPVTASQILLRNSANLPIAWTAIAGQVWVNCPVPTDGNSWSTLKSTYR